jgi:hypothetical protein
MTLSHPRECFIKIDRNEIVERALPEKVIAGGHLLTRKLRFPSFEERRETLLDIRCASCPYQSSSFQFELPFQKSEEGAIEVILCDCK